jgi:hypothetical protein
MRTLWPPLLAAIALAASLSGCADAYETFGPPAAAAKTSATPAEKPTKTTHVASRKGSPKTAAAGGGEDAAAATGACITFQFMGGADCEQATKRNCYDKRMNVADWRKGVACQQAAVSAAAPREARSSR